MNTGVEGGMRGLKAQQWHNPVSLGPLAKEAWAWTSTWGGDRGGARRRVQRSVVRRHEDMGEGPNEIGQA